MAEKLLTWHYTTVSHSLTSMSYAQKYKCKRRRISNAKFGPIQLYISSIILSEVIGETESKNASHCFRLFPCDHH